MNRTFKHAQRYNSDVYVVDYTHSTDGKRGVEILSAQPVDGLATLHVKNPNMVEYWGVNFEEHGAFFKYKDKNGNEQKADNCECMFVASKAKHKGWMLLAELKYCETVEAVDSNAETAYLQLLHTLDWLVQKKVAKPTRHRVYLNVSIPPFSEREPFTSFLQTQDDILDGEPGMLTNCVGSKLFKQIADAGFELHVLGMNSVLIYTYANIMIPKQLI